MPYKKYIINIVNFLLNFLLRQVFAYFTLSYFKLSCILSENFLCMQIKSELFSFEIVSPLGKKELLSIFILCIEKNNKCTHGLTDNYGRTVIHWHSPNHVNIMMCHFNLTSEVVYHGATWVFFKPKLGKIKKSTPEQNSYFSENGTFLTQKNLIKLFKVFQSPKIILFCTPS